MEKKDKPYGYELIMDLHGCDASTFNRESLDAYFEKVCNAIDMVRSDRFWWDDMDVPEEQKQTLPHTKGTSAVQFILTSSIVVHTLDILEAVYVNVFTCKEFDEKVAEKITREWFGAKECKTTFIERT
jgi:S-adenosylmethionine/arginine decarboxylase-like enzyme